MTLYAISIILLCEFSVRLCLPHHLTRSLHCSYPPSRLHIFCRFNARHLPLIPTLKTPNSTLEVRAGYLGICVRQNDSDTSLWLCSNNAAGLAQQFSAEQDPLNLLWVCEKFKDAIVFYALM